MFKPILLFVFFIFLKTPAISQISEFNTSDLQRTALKVGFVGVKNLKNLSKDGLKIFFNELESDRMLLKQININSWGVCEFHKIDNFDLYNYYYADVSRETFKINCKELNALMLLDGTISQIK
jgi:hypothetical protein